MKNWNADLLEIKCLFNSKFVLTLKPRVTKNFPLRPFSSDNSKRYYSECGGL